MRKSKVRFSSILPFMLILSACVSYGAPDKDRGQALQFPARYNHVQPLPQKFEYSLRDSYRFLLGNRIIDTSHFEFDITPTATSIEVRMKWPANLFDKGNLVLLSPSGVSILSTPLKQNQNEYFIQNGNPLLTQLLGLSFFKFCISQYELNTGMEVCSPELVAKGRGANLKIISQPNTHKPRIQINGRAVTPHGIVFLNDEKESLSFRAIAASGAEFKMDTRSINLEFLDVLNVNDSLMSITIKGPFPLAPAQYKIIKDDVWSVTLKKDRALVYIAGEGKVPLRQEFVVQGNLPTEANRLYLEKTSPTRAYASGLQLYGWTPQKGTPQAADTGAEVVVTGSRFSWALKNLSIGQDKMSTIQIVDGSDVFTAGYSFSRAFANRIEILGGLNSYKNKAYFGAEAQMWLESLPFLSRLTQQHVGLGVTYNQDLIGKIKNIQAELDAYWRINKGLQFYDASYFAGIALQNWTYESNSLQTFAPILGWMGPSFKRLKYFDWQEFYLKYSLAGKSGQVELKSRTELKWKLYQPMKDQARIRYTAGFYSEEAAEKASGVLLEAAWVYVF